MVVNLKFYSNCNYAHFDTESFRSQGQSTTISAEDSIPCLKYLSIVAADQLRKSVCRPLVFICKILSNCPTPRYWFLLFNPPQTYWNESIAHKREKCSCVNIGSHHQGTSFSLVDRAEKQTFHPQMKDLSPQSVSLQQWSESYRLNNCCFSSSVEGDKSHKSC